jgi:hypothetical protein
MQFARRLSDIAMCDEENEMRSDARPQARKNLKVSSLEYIEDSSGPRTMQMVIDRSPE